MVLIPKKSNKVEEYFFEQYSISPQPLKFAKSSPNFWLQYIQSKGRWRFRKILWPSQNIWTLTIIKFSFQFTVRAPRWIALHCNGSSNSRKALNNRMPFTVWNHAEKNRNKDRKKYFYHTANSKTKSECSPVWVDRK